MEVVFGRHLRASLQDCSATYARLAGNRDVVVFPEIDTETLEADYRSFVSDRLKELHFSVLGNESARIDTLVDRALQRRKPFDGHGRAGFRDAVQWEVMLGVIQRTVDPVLFVTSNKRDFGGHGSLAKDLQDDLNRVGRSGSVTICEGLDAFITQFGEPTLERLDDIAHQVGEGQYKSFHTDDFVAGLMPEIESTIKAEVVDNGLAGLDYIARQYFLNPVLNSIDDDFQVMEADVYRMNDDVVALTLTIEFKGTIKCEEEATPDPAMAAAPYFEDFIGDATFKVECGAVINETTGDVLEESVDDVSIVLGCSWPYADDD